MTVSRWILMTLAAAIAVGPACLPGRVGDGDGGVGGYGHGDVPTGQCPAEEDVAFCYPGSGVTRSLGVCQDGIVTCSGGTWGPCLGYVVPTTVETCSNKLDDDCNGLVDEGCGCEPGAELPCYTGPATTYELGACKNGVQACEGGTWSTNCVGEVLPSSEVCDQVDNDCNGLIDTGCTCVNGATQSCYDGPAGTNGVGPCKGGVQTCAGSAWPTACDGAVLPSAEACDKVDNDCDGLTDPGCTCVSGTTQACYGGPPTTLKVGPCKAGTQSCTGGQWSSGCPGEVLPAPEVCNGQDDDCNGESDNGNPGGGGDCNTGQAGVCGPGSNLCKNGSISCNPNQAPSAEACNGQDDDCNGESDNGNPGGGGVCNTDQVGVCATAKVVCKNGAFTCPQDTLPSDEVCDGLDNNCDGQTDENNPGGGTFCDSGQLGNCSAGYKQCKNGNYDCVPYSDPTQENCDGQDNDCDGIVDNNPADCPQEYCFGGVCFQL